MQVNNNFIPPDQQARDTAVLETSKNIIVEAGAGTGKTTLLTDRLCYLILGKGIAIDKIIALTFTEKAAAEIKARLLDKMRNILLVLKGQAEPSEEISRLIYNFGRNKDDLIKEIERNFELAERAMISTIHGFCFKILRRFPAEADIAPDAQPDSNEAAQAITDKIWSAFLDEELNYRSANAELWEKLLQKLSLEEIKDFALSLLKEPLAHYKPDFKDKNIAKILQQKAALAADLLEKYKSKRKNAFDEALSAAIPLLNNTAAYHKGFEYQEINFDLKTGSRPTSWTDEEDFAKAKDIIELAKNSSIENIRLLKMAMQAVSGFIPKAKEALKKSNLISFDEMILKTRDLVKNHLYIRQTLKEEYKSILLDEFQDTDPEQGEIFLYLSEADSEQAKDWQEVQLKPGKLFIVGDPKQSIYRFRGADISAYDSFIDAMIRQGAVKCFLQSNFRSSQTIVSFANRFGSKAIIPQKNIQPEYIEIKHTKNYHNTPVQIIVSDPGEQKISAEEMRRFQADIIAAWIKENAFKKQLSDGKVMTYKDIAVLYRTATGLGVLIDAFKRAGINYSVEESKNFYQAQEVKDIINLLKLAQNPLDRTALTGVLRSPLCLVRDEDILKLSQNNLLNIYADSGDIYINACFDMLKEICRRARVLPLEEFINYILFETRFKEMEILCSASEQASANISKFMDIARRFSASGLVTLPQFIYHIEFYFKEREKEGESPLAEESLDTVKLMSIHKSKGLQFPVVIIYDITKEENKGNKKEPQFLSDWLSACAAPRIGKIKDINYTLLEQINTLHAKAEELRILYVALTRAKERLLIIGSKEAKKTLAEPLQIAGCYPGESVPQKLLDGICDVSYLPYKEADLSAYNPFTPEEQGQSAANLTLWRSKWLERSKEYQTALANKPIAPSAANKQNDETPLQTSAMLSGRICHRILSEIFQNYETNINNIAIIEGANPTLNAKEIADAQQIVSDFKQSAAFKKLAGMKLLSSELPFSLKNQQNDGYISGIIDAVFEDSDGKIFIAEFKSDNINKEQIQACAVKYMPQLEVYINAAKMIFKGKKITGALIFLRPKEIYYSGED